jgi:acyl-CoA oxidase
MLHCFVDTVNETKDDRLKPILTKLCNLFGLSMLESHLDTLCEDGFFGLSQSHFVRKQVMIMCNELRRDAVPLVDAFYPKYLDFVIGSPMGMYDGQGRIATEKERKAQADLIPFFFSL